GFVADWDTFTQSRGKNAYFYRRAHDGRFQWLQWDSDLAFGNRSRGSFYGGSDAFVRWMEQPEQQAAFRDMLDKLVSLTSGSKSRVEAWMAQEASANPKTAINIPFYRSFFKQRREDVANSR
ncbi:MAG: CotH kinase family protein, partial [Limisphaerales bacterium]